MPTPCCRPQRDQSASQRFPFRDDLARPVERRLSSARTLLAEKVVPYPDPIRGAWCRRWPARDRRSEARFLQVSSPPPRYDLCWHPIFLCLDRIGILLLHHEQASPPIPTD